MKQYLFGSGSLWLTRTDLAVPTPRKFGVLQEVSLELKFETKELRGAFRFPVDTADGPASITGKYKNGQINGRLYADLIGGAYATAQKVPVVDEAGTIPAPSGPYTITVSGSSAFYEDLGVQFADTGQQLERVLSSPATGQYSMTAGVYTFAAADANRPVLISYNTTKASPTAPNSLITVDNTLMGAAPAYALNLHGKHRGKDLWIKLEAIAFSGFTLPLKMDDYMIPEGSFSAFANDAGRIMSLSAPA